MKKKTLTISPKLSLFKRTVTDPRRIYHVGRNDPCPCGSFKKYKDCHADAGEAYLKKLERQRMQDELRARGVPLWKRWLMMR